MANVNYGKIRPFTRGYHKAKARGRRDLKEYKMVCLVRGRSAGVSVAAMSVMLGVTTQTLYKWAKDRKRTIPFPQGDKSVQWTTVGALYDSPARRRGRKRRESGETWRKRRKSPANPREGVERMLILRRNGMSVADIAGEVGRSVQTIHAAIRRWPHWRPS